MLAITTYFCWINKTHSSHHAWHGLVIFFRTMHDFPWNENWDEMVGNIINWIKWHYKVLLKYESTVLLNYIQEILILIKTRTPPPSILLKFYILTWKLIKFETDRLDRFVMTCNFIMAVIPEFLYSIPHSMKYSILCRRGIS